MKHIARVFIFFISMSLSLHAQIKFFKAYGSNNSDTGDDLTVLQDGGYGLLLHSGYNFPVNSLVNLGFVKTDVTGETVSTTEIRVDSSCVGKKIIELSNKDFFILGTATDGSFMNSNKLFLMRVNNTGNPIWCYHYKFTTSDQAIDITPTHDGNYLILATSNYNIGFEEVLIIKVNPAGGVIWHTGITTPNNSQKELHGVSIREFENGDIVVGASLYMSSFLDACIIKLNSSGNMIWSKIYRTTYDDELQKVAVNAANEIYIAGYSYFMSTGWDFFVAKLDSTGDVQFQHFYDGGKIDGEKVRDMELASGRIALIGDWGSYDERNIFITSIYTNGNIAWAKEYNYAPNFTNYPFGLEIVNNNQYAFTGDVRTPFAQREAPIIKTNIYGDAGCTTNDIQFTKTSNEELYDIHFVLAHLTAPLIKTDLGYHTFTPNNISKPICEFIPPVAAFDTLTLSSLCPNYCISFTDTSLYTPTEWHWYFEGGTPDTSSLQNPANICWKNAGTYDVKLVVKNNNGTDSITHPVKITLDCPIFIPNVFSPNTDANNDVFRLSSLPEKFDLVIYNRWGETMFKSSEATDMWNGKVENEGAMASEGVYYYVLFDYSHQKQYKGFLHLFY